LEWFMNGVVVFFALADQESLDNTTSWRWVGNAGGLVWFW